MASAGLLSLDTRANRSVVMDGLRETRFRNGLPHELYNFPKRSPPGTYVIDGVFILGSCRNAAGVRDGRPAVRMVSSN